MQRRRREARDDTLSMRPQPSRLGLLMQCQHSILRCVDVWKDRAIVGPKLVLTKEAAVYRLAADERPLEHRHRSTIARLGR
jgi:hypothetical protein